jgi:hypothetical protein
MGACGQSEEPLFEDGILPVPEGQAEAEALHVVGNACDAVLAPAVGARAGVIVGEEIPGVTVLAVVERLDRRHFVGWSRRSTRPT